MPVPAMHHFVILAVAVAMTSLAACTPAEEPPIHVAALVTPVPTEHGVGRSELAWADATRDDGDAPSGKRELRGWLYYPTTQAPAMAAVALDGNWAEAYRPSLERRLGVAAAKAMLTARWHAGHAAAAPGRFPVLVFAHGYHQLPTNYSALLEGLASRGYAVLAIASPGVAQVVPLPRNRMAPNLPLDDRSYDTMAMDIASAVNQLPALDASSGTAYAGHLDLQRIGVFGHSIGGAAAVLASARLPQVRAAANLDGDYAGASAAGQPRVPLLYITSQPPNRPALPKSDWDTEHNEVRRARIWRDVARNSPRAIRVRVAGMFHANFQDDALLPASAMPRKLRENRYGAIDGARGLDLTVRMLDGFFSETLCSAPADSVQAVVKQFPEADVQFMARPPGPSPLGQKQVTCSQGVAHAGPDATSEPENQRTEISPSGHLWQKNANLRGMVDTTLDLIPGRPPRILAARRNGVARGEITTCARHRPQKESEAARAGPTCRDRYFFNESSR